MGRQEWTVLVQEWGEGDGVGDGGGGGGGWGGGFRGEMVGRWWTGMMGRDGGLKGGVITSSAKS